MFIWYVYKVLLSIIIFSPFVTVLSGNKLNFLITHNTWRGKIISFPIHISLTPSRYVRLIFIFYYFFSFDLHPKLRSGHCHLPSLLEVFITLYDLLYVLDVVIHLKVWKYFKSEALYNEYSTTELTETDRHPANPCVFVIIPYNLI